MAPNVLAVIAMGKGRPRVGSVSSFSVESEISDWEVQFPSICMVATNSDLKHCMGQH